MCGRACRLVRALVSGLALLCAAQLHAQDGVQQSGDVRVHYWNAQRRLAESIASTIAPQRFPGLPPDVLSRGTTIDLYIAPDAARFDALTGGRAPEWGAGVAIPDRNMIIVPGYVSERAGVHELPVIVRHELAHIALQRHLGTARVPRWFTEGYATWAAGQFDDRAGWMLRVGFMTDAAPPLDSLTLDWPDLAPNARMAYLLSASAVRYLYTLGREDTFTSFLDHWRDSGSLEQSMRAVYVLSSAQFERLWHAHVKRSYGWTQVIAQTAFVWLLVTLMVLLLFIVRRRRDRKRMQRLREAELPDEPAYWIEPPPEESEPITEEGEGSDEDDGRA